MPIDPNIVLGIHPLQLTQPDPIEQYSKGVALKGLMQNQQINAYALDKARREDTALNEFQAKVAGMGGPNSIPAIADAMIKTGNPQYVQFGVALQQKYQAHQALREMAGMGTPAAQQQPQQIGPGAPAPSPALGGGTPAPSMPISSDDLNAPAPGSQPEFGVGSQQFNRPQLGGMGVNPRVLGLMGGGTPNAPQAPIQQPVPQPMQQQQATQGVNLNPRVLGLLAMDDPGATKAAELLNAIDVEARKPQNVRPEGTIAVPDGQGGYRQAYYSSKVGEGMTKGQQGEASVVPGYVQGKTQVIQAQEGAKQPFQTGITKVPILLPGGDQRTAELNPVQMQHYNQTGQLPPEIARALGMPTSDAVRLTAPDEATAALWSKQLSGQGKQFSIDVAGKPSSAKPVVGLGQSQSENITQQRQQAGGKATDEAFAKDYLAFTQGGAADAAKQLAQLNDTLTALQKPGSNLTGSFVGRLPDVVRNVTNPNAVAMRERVEEVVQRSLRSILGAQFTENEGKRLIERAYNPSQPPAENAIRVGRLLTQLQQAYTAKQDASVYFQKNGTLEGWNGKLPSMSDFDVAGAAPSGVAAQSTGVKFLGFEK